MTSSQNMSALSQLGPLSDIILEGEDLVLPFEHLGMAAIPSSPFDFCATIAFSG